MNTLEKDFVPYEQALELRELGFDEPHFKSYVGISNNGDIKDCTYVLCNGKLNNDDVSAPTFSQAFRWFRKTHKLGAIVSQFGYGIEDEYGQIIYNIDDDEKPLCYEEAEIACLIKLIEIVKNK
jgi:hypothetical protein